MTQGFDPGPAIRRRYALLGYPGCGKTTFLNSISGCLILDFEDSGRSLPNPKAARFGPIPHAGKAPRWEDYKGVIAALIQDQATTYQHVAFDTIDAMVDCVVDWYCRKEKIAAPNEGKKGQSGWYNVRIELFRAIESLELAGYGWTAAAHMEDTDQGTDICLSPKIGRKFLGSIQHLLYCNVDRSKDRKIEDYTTTDGKKLKRSIDTGRWNEVYYLGTRPGPTQEKGGLQKSRVPLPDRIDVGLDDGWSSLVAAYDKSVAELQGDIQQE